jgi:murein DD-endopeptidase MepM/ murein hydrolase activator NlpD
MFLKRFILIFSGIFLYACSIDSTNELNFANVDSECLSRNESRYPESAESDYVLPFNVGERFLLGQGNCTNFTHSESEMSEFAFDFIMDIGTPIHAARAGIVIAVEEQSFDNDLSSPENLILIKHDDGSLAFYVHLTNNGASVEPGQEVMQDDFIGFSGNTGVSTRPHLHFEVIELNEQCFSQGGNDSGKIDNCPSIPVSFSNAQPNDRILMQGVFYSAL